MDSDCYRDGGRLLADIGGTNARFAIERAPGRIEAIATLRCAALAASVQGLGPLDVMAVGAGQAGAGGVIGLSGGAPLCLETLECFCATAQIPTLVITAPYPALSGAATLLAEHLADAPTRRFPLPAPLHTERSHASI